ncbi:guanylate kinase [Citroniella saccharovorans]|uniref:Guanylate kinase n=1 Tax=Citroniella saccharovorans TaxID=2053367 RepID=A0AAW9MPN8_9FIRM|nr:guanylate kinase [Citroniella saccharovorans]MEB3429503.1 guanylate kinase [Citroniella saccharovorans]
MRKGKLFVVSGPSGVGKGSICSEVIKGDENINFSVSVTTRLPRAGEIEGIHYFFRKKEEFENLISENSFLEYAKVFDNYYGTLKDYVFEKLDKGENIILDIDTQGALNVKANYSEAILVFILPPSLDELKSRLMNRATENESELKKRINGARAEIKKAINYDYIIINDDLNKAICDLKTIIYVEKLKTDKKVIENILEEEI